METLSATEHSSLSAAGHLEGWSPGQTSRSGGAHVTHANSRIKTTSRVHITAGGIRHDLLEQAHTLSEDQLQNIEGSFRLSEEIAHQGIATATPTFSQRLQSFGYSLMLPDTTPNRNLFDHE